MVAQMERLIEQGRNVVPDSPVMTRALLWSAVMTRMMATGRPDPSWVHGRLDEGIARARSAGDREAERINLLSEVVGRRRQSLVDCVEEVRELELRLAKDPARAQLGGAPASTRNTATGNITNGVFGDLTGKPIGSLNVLGL